MRGQFVFFWTQTRGAAVRQPDSRNSLGKETLSPLAGLTEDEARASFPGLKPWAILWRPIEGLRTPIVP